MVCWRPQFGGPTELTRALSSTERGALEAHREGLAHALEPFGEGEQTELAATLGALFSGFRSMRQTGDSVGATIEITLAVLREFPAWAIKKACLGIAQGKFPDIDQRFPPNDTQIHAAVTDLVAYHRRRLADTERLIEAKVADRTPLKSRERVQEEFIEKSFHDGKHAQRIKSDLEKRKQRNEELAQASEIAAE